jgi:polyphosphate:AMP phosphotransferase
MIRITLLRVKEAYMLEKVDLQKTMEKEVYKEIFPGMEIKMGELQRKIKELDVPVIIVFEGWDAAGKGTLINELILPLDPRGFKVHGINPPNEEERLKPFLWRFWIKTPAKGRIAVFDTSWYGAALEERVNGSIKDTGWNLRINDMNSFERQLADDGSIIIKFFLHISKKEQKKRFEAIEENPSMSWKVTEADWKRHKKYSQYRETIEEMLERTDTAHAPWTIVESHDKRFAAVKIFTSVIEAIEKKIEELSGNKAAAMEKGKEAEGQVNHPEELNTSILDRIDLTKTLSEKEYNAKLDRYQKKIREIEHEMYMKRKPLAILYEGWDAAGKGGNIRRLTKSMDPRGYEVVPISAPSDIEKAHHYLWRFWNVMPKAGHITVFDRTWYGRVLVERIEGFCSEEEWKRAYREINEMEEHLVNSGMVLVKFWLHIDRDEQLRRFEERQALPYKQWKITEEDWRNRDKWDRYKEAVDEMLFRTSTKAAPWTVVESNSKYYARVKTLKTVIGDASQKLK